MMAHQEQLLGRHVSTQRCNDRRQLRGQCLAQADGSKVSNSSGRSDGSTVIISSIVVVVVVVVGLEATAGWLVGVFAAVVVVDPVTAELAVVVGEVAVVLVAPAAGLTTGGTVVAKRSLLPETSPEPESIGVGVEVIEDGTVND
jgi:hypothetical protein